GAQPLASTAAMAIGLLGVNWALLRNRFRRPPLPAPVEAPFETAPGIAGAFAAEWRRVVNDRSVFSLFVLGPVLYGFLYPQPYLGQLLKDIPIAVVDGDRTELSRTLIQTLDAHE